jgi:tetratricopeptide (TPR) repeat protein
MTKRIAIFLLLAATLALFASTAAAQDAASIRGLCRDEDGKVMAGASVEIANLANGSKLTVKTNKHGEYRAPDLSPESYKITLLAADGKPLLYFNNVPVRPAGETVVDFDLAKLKAKAAAQSGLSPEQRRQNEKINQQNEAAKKENEKIHALNALLQQAAQQKNGKQYDAAVATMEQAAALDQSHDLVYRSLADAYMLDKKFPQAEAAYRKTIALDAPASKSLAGDHAGLALALLRQGKIEAGMDECGQAAQLDAKQGGACYFNQGAILTNQGKADAADQAFDQAIAADPTLADAYYQKGVNLLARATLGRDNKMIPVPGTAEAFNKYLELAPDGRYAQSARDLLASIGASIQTSYGAKHGARGKP